MAGQFAQADDGYRLWLRYDRLPENDAAKYRKNIGSVFVDGHSATSKAIRSELQTALGGLLGDEPRFDATIEDNQLLIDTITSAAIKNSKIPLPAGDGFVIRTTKISGKNVTVIASQTETGALYGVFHYLRLIQTLKPIARLDINEAPKVKLRRLNHWDNQDGSIEHGYAGKSLWNWSELLDTINPRLNDYARAKASVGINAAVLNNVNASSQILTPEYIAKVAAIAAAFRPYGIKVFLSARFSTPMEIVGIKTADPFDDEETAVWAKRRFKDERFAPALRLDNLLNDWEKMAQKEKWDVLLDEKTVSIARSFLDLWIFKMKPLYLAVSLPDDFDYTANDARNRLFREVVLPTAKNHDLPFALMIGVRRGMNPALRGGDDGVGRADVGSLEKICVENPDVCFLSTFLSRENQHELCVTARKFANLTSFRLLVVSEQSVDHPRDHARTARTPRNEVYPAAFGRARARSVNLQMETFSEDNIGSAFRKLRARVERRKIAHTRDRRA